MTKAMTPMSDSLYILFKICILTFQCLCQILGAWWEVELRQSIDVKRVNIIQYHLASGDANPAHRLVSDSIVSLLDRDDKTITTYMIGGASQLESIGIFNTDSRTILADSCDESSTIETQKNHRKNDYNKFSLNSDGKLESKGCPGMVLTNKDKVCSLGN